jgi:hypothetical protein
MSKGFCNGVLILIYTKGLLELSKEKTCFQSSLNKKHDQPLKQNDQ